MSELVLISEDVINNNAQPPEPAEMEAKVLTDINVEAPVPHDRGMRRHALQIGTIAYARLCELAQITGYSRTSLADYLITQTVIENQVRAIKSTKITVRRPGRVRKSFHST